MDKVLQDNQELIKEYSYVTHSASDLTTSPFKRNQVTGKARTSKDDVSVFAAQPSILDSLLDDYQINNWQSMSALSLGEQLYSAKGSQSAGVGHSIVDEANINPESPNEFFLVLSNQVSNGQRNTYYKKRPLWTLSNVALFTMRDREVRCCNNPGVLMNLPAYNALVNNRDGMNNTRFEKIMVKLHQPLNATSQKKIKKDFKESIEDPDRKKMLKFYDFLEDEGDNKDINWALDVIFSVVIAVTMFLCFFSLCASMSANLMDQSKEIGILRAMGFTKRRIKVLYFYEAFILVSASCLLGVMIGTIVGFTMVLQ